MARTKLSIVVDFNPKKTDGEGLAMAFDKLLKTTLSTPGIMSEYGDIQVAQEGFSCQGIPSGKVVDWVDKGKLDEETPVMETVEEALQAGAKALERWLVNELIGEPVFKAEDGKYYTIRAIPVFDEVVDEELPKVRVTGTVTESLVIEKSVSVRVRKNATQEEIEQAIRAKAYNKTIRHNDHGWDAIDTSDVSVKIDEKTPDDVS